jgi:hypothetical protein
MITAHIVGADTQPQDEAYISLPCKPAVGESIAVNEVPHRITKISYSLSWDSPVDGKPTPYILVLWVVPELRY